MTASACLGLCAAIRTRSSLRARFQVRGSGGSPESASLSASFCRVGFGAAGVQDDLGDVTEDASAALGEKSSGK